MTSKTRCPGSNTLPAKHDPWGMTCATCGRIWIEGHHLAGKYAPIHYVTTEPTFSLETDGVREDLAMTRDQAWEVYGAVTDGGTSRVILREGEEIIATYEPFANVQFADNPPSHCAACGSRFAWKGGPFCIACDAPYAGQTIATIHAEHEPNGPTKTLALCDYHLRTAVSCLMVDATSGTTDEPCHFCAN